MPLHQDTLKAFLVAQGYTGPVADAINAYLKDRLAISSTLTISTADLWKQYLVSLGYSGTLEDMFYSMEKDGGLDYPYNLLMEDGFDLLLEDGFQIIL